MANIKGDAKDATLVPALLFNERGKWKYSVKLRYVDADFEQWDVWTATRQALARATAANESGVTLTTIPQGWMLVVEEPFNQNSHPIMVVG